MYLLKIIAFCWLLVPFSFGQISFYNTYSDNAYDVGEGIVQLADSSYLLTGSSSSFSGSKEAFIMHVDSLGNRLWSKHYGGAEADMGRRIFHVAGDGIYVAGQSNSFGGFYDAYFFKTDLSGTMIYEKHYGSNAYENIHDAVMLKDTSFILVGETYDTQNETENAYVIRVNKTGELMWTRNFGSGQKDIAHAVKVLNDTTVVIAGEYYVADSLTQKAMLAKMHINGTIDWIQVYGNSGKYVLNDLHIQNNRIRAVGYNQYDLNLTLHNRQFMMRCDENGITDWELSEIKDGDYSFECITQYGSSPDDFYFASKISANYEFPMYLDGCDIEIYKFHGDMYFNNAKFYPSNDGDDVPNQLIPTSDKGAILIGANNKPSNQGSNVLLVKIGPYDYFPYSNTIPVNYTLVSLKEVQKQTAFDVFPNPTENSISLDLTQCSGKKYVIYSQAKQEITSGECTTNSISLENLSPGVYYLEIENYVTKIVKL